MKNKTISLFIRIINFNICAVFLASSVYVPLSAGGESAPNLPKKPRSYGLVGEAVGALKESFFPAPASLAPVVRKPGHQLDRALWPISERIIKSNEQENSTLVVMSDREKEELKCTHLLLSHNRVQTTLGFRALLSNFLPSTDLEVIRSRQTMSRLFVDRNELYDQSQAILKQLYQDEPEVLGYWADDKEQPNALHASAKDFYFNLWFSGKSERIGKLNTYLNTHRGGLELASALTMLKVLQSTLTAVGISSLTRLIAETVISRSRPKADIQDFFFKEPGRILRGCIPIRTRVDEKREVVGQQEKRSYKELLDQYNRYQDALKPLLAAMLSKDESNETPKECDGAVGEVEALKRQIKALKPILGKARQYVMDGYLVDRFLCTSWGGPTDQFKLKCGKTNLAHIGGDTSKLFGIPVTNPYMIQGGVGLAGGLVGALAGSVHSGDIISAGALLGATIGAAAGYAGGMAGNKGYEKIKEACSSKPGEAPNPFADGLSKAAGMAYSAPNQAVIGVGLVGMQIYDTAMLLNSMKSSIYEGRRLWSTMGELRHHLMCVKRFINGAQSLAQLLENADATAYAKYIKDLRVTNNAEFSEKFKELMKTLSLSTFTGSTDSLVFWRGNVLHAHRLLKEVKDELIPMLNAIAHIDVHLSMATFVRESANTDTKWSFVDFVSQPTPVVALDNCWLPLLKKGHVPNDLYLGTSEHAGKALLTGPNGGGKSTIIKSVGLSVFCAQAWGIAPASKAVMTITDQIITCFRSEENVLDDISTFMAALKDMQSVQDRIEGAREKSQNLLVLVDEPYRGTVDVETADRIYAFGKTLARYPSVLSILATHVEKPSSLAKETNGIFGNYHVAINELSPNVFERTYKISRGSCDWWFRDARKRSAFVDWLSGVTRAL